MLLAPLFSLIDFAMNNWISPPQAACPHFWTYTVPTRVSFETSFDSKQPKLEPKLVLALSEAKRLFRLFRFYTETESFDVSIEPKQTEDPPRQFKRE
jgi:preprotein translocase subunit Sec61beta